MMKRNLLFLLTFIVSTMTVWAEGIGYNLTLDDNWAGGLSTTIPNISSGSNITLPSRTRPNFEFLGWTKNADGSGLVYTAGTNYTVTKTDTLYGKWDHQMTVGMLKYRVTSESSNTVEIVGHESTGPTGAFEIPATVTVDNVEYSVTSLGYCAFWSCTGLSSVTIPNSVTSIGEYVFENCSNLTTISVDNDNNYYSSADGVLFNKDKTTLVTCPEGKTESYTIPNSVTSIGNNAFRGCSGLTSVTISNSVTSIGGNAFDGCTGLTSVTIGNSLKSIGGYAFNHCTDLTSITIPNSVTTIGYNAFWRCTGLTSVTIGNSVTSIESCAFAECSGLTSVTIGNSVTSIEEFAFIQCTKLSSVYVLATTPPTLGKDAFSYNATGRKIYVPSGSVGDSSTSGTYKHDWSAYADVIEALPVKASGTCGTNVTWTLYKNGLLVISNTGAMADYEYQGAPWYNDRASITSVEIGSGVTSIGTRAFDGCGNLISVTIPNSVTNIGDGAFTDCTGLTSVTIPNSVTSIGVSSFSYCTNLTSVIIPNSVTSIGENAFWNCTSLTSVTIPNSVTSIGDDAFHGCSGLTSITIPNSVTRIRRSAFDGCSGLTSITIPSSVTQIDQNAFSNCI